MWIATTQLLLQMADMIWLVCSASLYGMLECKLCYKIVLLLNVADVLYAGRLVSEQ